MAQLPRALTYHGIPVWRHSRIIQWTAQIVSAFITVGLVVWFFTNIANAVRERDIPHGFGFLSRSYQTPIGIHFIPYESSDTFLYAFGVAAINTVIVAIVGVVLATMLGIAMGVLRLSGNWIVSRVALAYIEFFRNVPLIVQLFFWFYNHADAAAGAGRLRTAQPDLRQQCRHILSLAGKRRPVGDARLAGAGSVGPLPRA